jgi:FdhD protein
MIESTRQFDVHRVKDGRVLRSTDTVVVEEPLEIRIGKVSVVVTMRTPGQDAELAAGFLFSEGVIASHADIDELVHCDEPGEPESRGNVIVATFAPTVQVDLERLKRNFYATSSCGICGKSSIEQVRRQAPALCGDFKIDASLIPSMVPAMRRAQGVFDETGGLHAAAVFDLAGAPLRVREDVSRHNAVDKVLGWALLDDRLPLHQAMLCVSGRASFEIVQKALAAGIGAVAAVSAASSLAIELAREAGMTLLGFVRDRRYVVYCGADRII